jgi:hypothetical protein
VQHILAINRGHGIPYAAKASGLVGLLDNFSIIRRYRGHGCCGWLGQEKGVVRVSRRVLLWLKEGIKIPEGRLHIIICWHFREAHLGEDFAELRPHL